MIDFHCRHANERKEERKEERMGERERENKRKRQKRKEERERVETREQSNSFPSSENFIPLLYAEGSACESRKWIIDYFAVERIIRFV